MSRWIVWLMGATLCLAAAGSMGLGCIQLPSLGDLIPDGLNNDTTNDGSNDGTDDGTDDGTNDGTDDGTNDDDNQAGGLTVVKTAIPVRYDAGLQCGTDLIAFGTQTDSSSIVGVSYVIPSTNPTVGTPVPDSELYDNSGFAVGGRNIFLAGSPGGSLAYQVSVFNADTAAITKTFTTDEIRLAAIPVNQDDPGNIRADGNYCVVICDANEVTDGKTLKVIDASTNPPTLIALEDPSETNIQQVDVDAATKRVVAASSDLLFIYDLNNPTAAPVEVALPHGIDGVQMEITGDYLITLDNDNYASAFLVNLATATYITLTDSLASGTNVGIGADNFAFFAYFDADDAVGGHFRATVGTMPGPGFEKAPLDNRIDGSTTNNGTVGFASTLCVVPSGTYKNYVFLANWYLQYSTGSTSFTVPADPTGTDTYGTPAWDVACSASVVGFKTATNRTQDTDTTLGYVKLQ